jgi:glutaminase
VDEPITEHLDLYFEQCSILVSAMDLAVMAATLANDGVNPLSTSPGNFSARLRRADEEIRSLAEIEDWLLE